MRVGGNSLGGADSELSFERENRVTVTSGGEVRFQRKKQMYSTEGCDKTFTETHTNGAEDLGLSEITWQSPCEQQQRPWECLGCGGPHIGPASVACFLPSQQRSFSFMEPM